jgi:hypothetical protein
MDPAFSGDVFLFLAVVPTLQEAERVGQDPATECVDATERRIGHLSLEIQQAILHQREI